MRDLFSFPDPVNDLAARSVATGVVVLGIAIVLTRSPLLLVLLALGFVARVATGPSLSPLGQLATRVVAPRLGASRPVPGPPKRFAQAIGATLSIGAVIAWFGVGSQTLALVLVSLIVVAASLEAAFGFCLGCKMFGLLMRLGLIPESACASCADLSLRYPERQPVSTV